MKTFRNRDGSGESSFRYIHEDVDRHGNSRIYFWRGRGHRRVRIRALPGTPAFREAYDAAAALDTDAATAPPAEAGARPQRPPPARGTWRWLCVQYFDAGEFRQLGESTRTVRRGILERTWDEPLAPKARDVFGDMPVHRMTAKAVRVLRDRKADYPEAANGRLKAMRQVFAWGLEAEPDTVAANPARDVKYLESAGDGFHTWTVDEVRQFEARHPIGSKARLAMALLLFTGVRRSDAVKLGRQMIRDGWLRFTEVKGNRRKVKERELPVLPELQTVIERTPGDHLTFVVTEFGKPFTAAGFGNRFRKWCDEAGLHHCSAHGLRKAGATIAADNGATSHQLMAIYGWETLKEAERYTRKANRKRLAGDAMHLVVPSEIRKNFLTFPDGARPVRKIRRKTKGNQ